MVHLTTSTKLPVNRMFTRDAGHPTPNLSCIVGFESLENEDLFRTLCSEAHNYVLNISKTIRKELKWPPGQKTLRLEKHSILYTVITVFIPRFGVQPNGAMYENITSWVCMSVPVSGTVTYNCVPEVRFKLNKVLIYFKVSR